MPRPDWKNVQSLVISGGLIDSAFAVASSFVVAVIEPFATAIAAALHASSVDAYPSYLFNNNQ